MDRGELSEASKNLFPMIEKLLENMTTFVNSKNLKVDQQRKLCTQIQSDMLDFLKILPENLQKVSYHTKMDDILKNQENIIENIQKNFEEKIGDLKKSTQELISENNALIEEKLKLFMEKSEKSYSAVLASNLPTAPTTMAQPKSSPNLVGKIVIESKLSENTNIVKFLKENISLSNLKIDRANAIPNKKGCTIEVPTLENVNTMVKFINDNEHLRSKLISKVPKATFAQLKNRSTIENNLHRFRYGWRVIKWAEVFLNVGRGYIAVDHLIHHATQIDADVILLQEIPPDRCNSKLLSWHRIDLDTKLFAYADDLLLICCENSRYKLEKICNNSLDLISIWLKKNRLGISVDKCSALYIAPPGLNKGLGKGGVRNPVIKINNTFIKFRNNVKILGIVINRFLNWIDHAKYVKNKMGKKGREIRKISTLNWGLSPAVIKRIYLAGFERAIVYGAKVWWGGYNTLSTDAALFLSGLIPIELVLNFESKITCLNRPINIFKIGPNRTSNYTNELIIYTDGSKSENGVGAGWCAIYENIFIYERSYILFYYNSVFQAENIAIFKALEWFDDNNKFKSVHIAPDSL
ncbi:hypothetical protein LAZ67_13001183 [Cordylochernes scorpioides]|uniref:RNase H type-1 domain-containing protein n=1 Tax=Cordylochernes scorpioides TaxID=51811 RepID=A0ABY6L3L5_9ARAC|nr:hypothetical protein LAZ67_13001183 [Cordylochernes scorpioides]